jgi:predicted unusual protein kinase regulating ubiquinone biosynthesis (AarF/ABC1/UbiB family)
LAAYVHYSLWLSRKGGHSDDQNGDSKYSQLLKTSRTQQAVLLREALTNLGPTFVKAGQQLAIRPDLVPPEVLKELQKLCDSVRPIPDSVALRVLREELGLIDSSSNVDIVDDAMDTNRDLGDVFEDLHMVAAASLGQVYKARLKDSGREVAIKVLQQVVE